MWLLLLAAALGAAVAHESGAAGAAARPGVAPAHQSAAGAAPAHEPGAAGAAVGHEPTAGAAARRRAVGAEDAVGWAAAPQSVEAEAAAPAGALVDDASASGGRALALTGTQAVELPVSVATLSRLRVYARGT